MECESMLFVTNHIPYLLGLSNSVSNSFIDFYSCEVVSSSDMRKNEAYSFDHFASIMATFNLLHASSCEMVTFCDILHETRQKRKQILESAQNGPRISSIVFRCASYFQLSPRCLDIPVKHCLSYLIQYLEIIPTAFIWYEMEALSWR